MTNAKFRRWLIEQDLTLKDAGDLLGCSFSMVRMIGSGERRPGRALACAIERATRNWPLGPIRPEEWDLEVRA